MILVYRYRVKSLNGLLNRQARAVNYVWNDCNDVQKQALKWGKKWPSGFDLNYLTIGSGKELGLHSGTVNAVCEQYAKSRRQHRRPYLRWRGKKSLCWVPLKGRDLKREGDAFRFAGNTFRVFHGRPLPAGKIKDGTNFSQDARGNRYLNIALEVADAHTRPIRTAVGWSAFRTMLAYKSITNGARYEDVDEYLTTQTCSECGCISGPKGRARLNMRQWVCGDCGASHDRGVNASLNLLLRSGHRLLLRSRRRTPVQGISVL